MIEISRIQPGEEYLPRLRLEHFLDHPDEIFNRDVPITLYKCPKRCAFEYYAIEGNKRLMALYMLGVRSVDLTPLEDIDTQVLHEAYEIRRNGVKSWQDLMARIISDEEYDRLYRHTEEFGKEFREDI